MKGFSEEILRELKAYCKGWYKAGITAVPVGVLAEESNNSGDGYSSGREERPERLMALAGRIDGCTRCRLHEGRKNLVFGDGNPCAEVVFVGEGPGHDEDLQGKPFVGQAGRLLTRMIEALGWRREDVYICNVVKCRPPKNRTPRADEIEICSPFLFEQLEIIRPRVICALGSCAAQTLLSTKLPISRLRGKINAWRGIPVVATFHPAYLLRNPAEKRRAWEDFLRLYDTWRVGGKPNGVTEA
ncbi:uracil-DNA glycosylase [Thermodesulforhabdus norvegica]|uniref:Type-4 uracil-DNA glycosylase n=1 Tax=Thermodesulforhabdus norvegica TaxID=39841 RepID=A0A1I4VFV7_9BACT|nr:uracil-DNA glycosylase [Thermodesulforhabdus norvegica]SFN00055.1 DNA polymerase [Thermodesulforhabdus norvegica]